MPKEQPKRNKVSTQARVIELMEAGEELPDTEIARIRRLIESSLTDLEILRRCLSHEILQKRLEEQQ